jgi:serine/threonine protein kinase
MCIKEKRCAAWISLDSLGINSSGCLKDTQWLQSLIIPCDQSILNQALYIDLPNKKLSCVKNVAHGKFGYIDRASYKTSSKQVDAYVKRPILPGKSLLYEACIQKLVGENLTNIGFPTGAPQVLSIFRLIDNSICFAMEEIAGATTLNRYLESISPSLISSVIIDCLLQLSAMIWYLDSALGINHRDLKPSNFLITEHAPKQRIIQIENEILEIESTTSLTFIDFGFSCLGSTESHVSEISLSTVYSKIDPCPKEGRDMFLFLAFLYIDFHSKLPQKLNDLFESWLQAPGSNLCSFLRRDKAYATKWLYFMAGNESIKRFITCPYKIVKDLQSLT